MKSLWRLERSEPQASVLTTQLRRSRKCWRRITTVGLSVQQIVRVAVRSTLKYRPSTTGCTVAIGLSSPFATAQPVHIAHISPDICERQHSVTLLRCATYRHTVASIIRPSSHPNLLLRTEFVVIRSIMRRRVMNSKIDVTAITALPRSLCAIPEDADDMVSIVMIPLSSDVSRDHRSKHKEYHLLR